MPRFRAGFARSPIGVSIALSQLLDAWITGAYILFCVIKTCPKYSCSKLFFDEFGEMMVYNQYIHQQSHLIKCNS